MRFVIKDIKHVSKKDTYIYALIDPRNNECRYVGKTIDIERRLWQHSNFNSKNRNKIYSLNWLCSLKPLTPDCLILEVVPSGEDWVEAEQFWIIYFKSIGVRLTNHTIGGEGLSGYKASKETRAKMSAWQIGKKHSEETLIKMRKPRSNKAKVNISEGCKNRKHSEETKLKIGEAMKGHKNLLGHKHTEESKAKISAGLMGKRKGVKHSEESKAKISTARKAYFVNKKAQQELVNID